MADAARVLEEALSLAPDERAQIARELIESLGSDLEVGRELKLERLRAALDEGERSGFAEDSSLEGVLADFRANRSR